MTADVPLCLPLPIRHDRYLAGSASLQQRRAMRAASLTSNTAAFRGAESASSIGGGAEEGSTVAGVTDGSSSPRRWVWGESWEG